MKSPLVSICFPTFNASEYIEIVLDSIKNQIYENIQVVICDDKSNDETLALIEKYKGSLDIKLLINKINRGVAYSVAECIKNSDGEFLCMLGHDDIIHKDKVSKQIHLMMSKNCSISLHSLGQFDWESKNISKENYYTYRFKEDEKVISLNQLNKFPLLTPSIMFRKSIFNEKFLFYTSNEVDLLLYYLMIDQCKGEIALYKNHHTYYGINNHGLNAKDKSEDDYISKKISITKSKSFILLKLLEEENLNYKNFFRKELIKTYLSLIKNDPNFFFKVKYFRKIFETIFFL